MPRLSIITPVRNAAPWLEACIASAQKQDFPDWEWIWVNDHSTDSTVAQLTAFAEKDRRLQILSNPGRGIISALQAGWCQSTGQYITRMDADDLMPDGRLNLMVQKLSSLPRGNIVTGRVRYFSEGDEVSRGYRQYEAWLNETLSGEDPWAFRYRECLVASPNWMMHREDLRAVGGFEDLEYPEDYDLVLRWYRAGYRITTLPEVTLHWREHPQRSSRNSAHYNQKSFFRLKITRFLEYDYDPQRPLCLWGTGQKGKITARLLQKAGVPFHWMGIFRQPRKLMDIPIETYQNLHQLEAPQLLVAVYPERKHRQALEAELRQKQLQPGRDYWYL